MTSFNTQSTPASTQVAVFEDESAGSLTEIDTADIPVPTSLQETNSESIEVAFAGAGSVFQAQFDYEWVLWEHPDLVGCRRLSHNKRTRAWWWKYGVPIQRATTRSDGTIINEEYYLCRTCHLELPKGNCVYTITRGCTGVLSHFRSAHWGTFAAETNTPIPTKALEKAVDWLS